MHRFFIEPQTLTEDRTVWVGTPDHIGFRHLVASFREKIRNREWKAIDLSIRLLVKVDTWDGHAVLVEDLGTRSDYYVASAYLRAGILENTAIIVFADSHIPWESLREFKAVNPPRSTRRKDGAGGHQGETARTKANQPFRRTGKPDILAGGCGSPPKEGTADCRGKDPSSQSSRLTGRLRLAEGHQGLASKDPV